VPWAASASAKATVATATGQRVTLITGDVVRLTRDASGRVVTQLFKAREFGPGSVFRSYTLGGDEYVVPQSAVPYLGRTLDPRLFDISWLARHPDQQGQVRLTLRAGGDAARLPGLLKSHRSGLTMRASYSNRSARMFGGALALQSMQDHAAPKHDTGLFRTVRFISPPAPDRHVSRPSTGESVLTIKGINWAGSPDSGDGFNVYNVDDMALFAGSISFQGGTAQLTVPDGHYSALGFFYDFAGQRIFGVEVPQFTVSGDTTITIDARTATAAVSITTPKPATPKSTQMVLGRNDALGALGSYAFLAGTQSFAVAPIHKKPKIGALHYSIGERAYSAGSKRPYTFDLKYGSNGTISEEQTYAPPADSLARVDATYAADHRGQQSMDSRLAAFSWEQNIFGDNILLTTPTRRIRVSSSVTSTSARRSARPASPGRPSTRWPSRSATARTNTGRTRMTLQAGCRSRRTGPSPPTATSSNRARGCSWGLRPSGRQTHTRSTTTPPGRATTSAFPRRATRGGPFPRTLRGPTCQGVGRARSPGARTATSSSS
jgi:hypothetical protein